jgi:pimeloyl-ACP methyl ester carboxylesterase
MSENTQVPHVSIHRLEADGVTVFYREAGPSHAPVVLLLHGFPTSSFQYRELIPRLADRYRVIAPDLPGFGFTEVPEKRHYKYTFDALANTLLAFTDALHLERYALYVFDYGAPTGFRLAMARPERVTAIVSQNGNAYEEGLGDAWAPIQRYWREPTPENRETLRKALSPEGLRSQYTDGVPNPDTIAPEGYTLDAAMIARPGNMDIQLDLFLDYADNVNSTQRSKRISANQSPRCSQSGGRTIRSLSPQGPRPTGETTRTRRSNFLIRDTSHWRHMSRRSFFPRGSFLRRARPEWHGVNGGSSGHGWAVVRQIGAQSQFSPERRPNSRRPPI